MKKTNFLKFLSKRNYFKFIGIIVCTFLFTSAAYSQKTSKEERKTYSQAKKQLANEEYKLAQTNYLKLVEIDPKNEFYAFEGGLSYYFADFERAKCIPLFEATLANSKEDTIPEIYYYLARAYHFNGQYDKATDAFNKFKPFIKTNSNSGLELMKQSDHYIKISGNGSKYAANKNENIVVSNLSNLINSSYGEYAPVLKKDDNILLFTSRRKTKSNKTDKDLLPYENIYAAKRNNDTWELITDKEELEKYIPKHLNSNKHEAGIIYSSDGKTLYTYKNDIIWKSILENGKWSDLVELDKNINSSQYNIPSVSLSQDGNTIFFVSYRKDGVGGKDIYKSIKDSEGKWGKAENLGETINTKLDEDSPFLSKDGNTLYFSSKGHEGIGGYDIFKSEKINSAWTKPKNMGIPINSSLDDIYLIIDENEMNGFFSSSRDGGFGGMDIYQIGIPTPSKITNTINGLIVDNSDAPVQNASIIVKNISDEKVIGEFKTSAGKFSMATENIGKHELIIKAQNFEKQIVFIELPNNSSESDLKIKLNQYSANNETYQVLTLTSNNLTINKSDTIKLEKEIAVNTTDPVINTGNNWNTTIASYQEFFNYNSKEVNSTSTAYMDMIAKAINKNGEIYIEIKSSASRVPTKTYISNVKLAALRAEEAKSRIISVLTNKGINPNQIFINKINSVVEGPRYSGDYKNTEKYNKYQYVKITIK